MASSGGAPPTILVRADERDSRLLMELHQRGYRLAGFPKNSVEALNKLGVPIGFVDLAPELEGNRPAIPLGHLRMQAQRWMAAAESPGLDRALGIESRAEFRIIQAALRAHIEGSFIGGARVVERFDALAGPENIRLVLLRDDQSHPERTLATAARLRAIPSVHVPHGFPSSPLVASDVNADVIAAYGHATVEWFESNGNRPDRISITGNPAWEHYRSSGTGPSRREALGRMRFDPDVPTVMLATNYVANIQAYDLVQPEWPWMYFTAAARAVKELCRRRAIQLIVKLHPGDTSVGLIKRHQEFMETLGLPFALVVGHAEPWQLRHSDCVMCIESSIGVEAILLGTPVVNLRFDESPRNPRDRLFGDEDVLQVHSARAIAETLERALFDEGSRLQLRGRQAAAGYRFNYLLDGRASERVLQVILRQLDPEAAARAVGAGAPAPLSVPMSAQDRESVVAQHLAHAAALEHDEDLLSAAVVRLRGEQIRAAA